MRYTSLLHTLELSPDLDYVLFRAPTANLTVDMDTTTARTPLLTLADSPTAMSTNMETYKDLMDPLLLWPTLV
jgi:hypothetical protein